MSASTVYDDYLKHFPERLHKLSQSKFSDWFVLDYYLSMNVEFPSTNYAMLRLCLFSEDDGSGPSLEITRGDTVFLTNF